MKVSSLLDFFFTKIEAYYNKNRELFLQKKLHCRWDLHEAFEGTRRLFQKKIDRKFPPSRIFFLELQTNELKGNDLFCFSVHASDSNEPFEAVPASYLQILTTVCPRNISVFFNSFGPPSWKPEQLQLAIEAVKKGYSLTEAGKQYGIPRTTLSNKIYGRKRKR